MQERHLNVPGKTTKEHPLKIISDSSIGTGCKGFHHITAYLTLTYGAISHVFLQCISLHYIINVITYLP